MSEPPGGWELSRRLDKLEQSQGERFDRMEKLLSQQGSQYVALPTFMALKEDVDEVKADLKKQAEWKRNAQLALGIAAVGWLIALGSLIVTVIALVSQG